MNDVRVHGNFYGRVQMVSFRDFTEKLGNVLHLNGTVENKEKGRVEVFVEGVKETVDIFCKCLLYGPRMARVDSISLEYEDVTGETDGFRAIYPPMPTLPIGALGYTYTTQLPLLDKAGDNCDVCGCIVKTEALNFIRDEGTVWGLCPACHKAFTDEDGVT